MAGTPPVPLADPEPREWVTCTDAGVTFPVTTQKR